MGKFIQDDGDVIRSPIGRVSWCYIFSEDPKQKPGDEFKYKLTLMLPKNKKALETLGLNAKQESKVLADVETFVKESKEFTASKARAEFGAKYKGKRWNPVLDGDTDKNVAAFAQNANFWLIRVKTKFKPTVVDSKLNHIETDEDPEGLYSGCWVRIKLDWFKYGGENPGISYGLGQHIKKIANDELFDAGGTTAEEEWGEDEDDLDIEDSDFDKDDLDAEDDEDELG